MDRFQTSTFTWEILFSGMAITALGLAGAMFPLSEAKAGTPSAEDIDRIAEARMARFRQWLRTEDRFID